MKVKRKRKGEEPNPPWKALSVEWWRWHRLRPASLEARAVWLGLYSTAQSHRFPTGMWCGGLSLVAEETGIKSSLVEVGFAELLEIGLVEHDAANHVARLTAFPDDLDRASNGNGITAWWRMWRAVPSCAVRDNHVETLRWLVGSFTKNHQEAWDATFGTLPSMRRLDGSGNGPGNGSRNRSNVVDITEARNGSGNGSGNGLEEEEGILRSSLPDSGSGSRSSREITNRDPLTAAGWEAFERLRGGGESAVDLAHESVRRYGPRAAVQDGPSASSERFK